MDAGRLTVKRLVALLGPVGLLAACGDQAPAAGPEATATEIPSELRQAARPPAAAEGEVAIGTPMQDRVAVIGLLNKRNNLSQDIELKPGETRRIGNVIVRVQACERTAPWEMPRETGAFVQVFVQDRGTSEFKSRFSGWLFKNSPSLNVVEHPIYDVWVKDCKMSFPVRMKPLPAKRVRAMVQRVTHPRRARRPAQHLRPHRQQKPTRKHNPPGGSPPRPARRGGRS